MNKQEDYKTQQFHKFVQGEYEKNLEYCMGVAERYNERVRERIKNKSIKQESKNEL